MSLIFSRFIILELVIGLGIASAALALAINRLWALPLAVLTPLAAVGIATR